jgi:hypothetical protein
MLSVPSRYGELPWLSPRAVVGVDSRLLPHLRNGAPARWMLRYQKVEFARIRVYALWLNL